MRYKKESKCPHCKKTLENEYIFYHIFVDGCKFDKLYSYTRYDTAFARATKIATCRKHNGLKTKDVKIIKFDAKKPNRSVIVWQG